MGEESREWQGRGEESGGFFGYSWNQKLWGCVCGGVSLMEAELGGETKALGRECGGGACWRELECAGLHDLRGSKHVLCGM
ncbi:hypothetical protein T440DRAFT_146425 [Plenodomus tracheiphilus IPT5]|uniref:Uncharacterized protein n=1 Tax=Plenodomus tracheiphilus IPT5 TaxID=1408161 RepID=A0A6A7B361_9PLEO|nr:hypothetical protein T440DRAFT_146425 [Plenodomus tracheiphilus IPT5]